MKDERVRKVINTLGDIPMFVWFEKEKCGFGSYDALASEFETYDTIKELALEKKTKLEPVFSKWINEPLVN